MLNLLISIMGDTYGRVKEKRIVADSRQLASMILEVEGVMGWKRPFNENFYMKIVCEESYLDKAASNVNEKIEQITEKVQDLIASFENFQNGVVEKIRQNRDEILRGIR